MDGRNWNWDTDFGADFSDVEPAQYTVDEILSQFREEYAEGESVPAAEDPEERHVSDFAEIPEEELFQETEQISAEDEITAAAEPSENKEKKKPEVGFMHKKREKKREKRDRARAPKSWKSLLSDSRGGGSRSESNRDGDLPQDKSSELPAAGTDNEDSLWNELSPENKMTAEPESVEQLLTEETAEEELLWRKLINEVKTEPEPEKQPKETDPSADTAEPAPEPDLSDYGRPEPDSKQEKSALPSETDDAAAETETEAEHHREAEKGSGRRNTGSGKKQKVWEEFPETREQTDEPFNDTLDYSVLFKMFADQPEVPKENGSADSAAVRERFSETDHPAQQSSVPAHAAESENPEEKSGTAKEHRKEPEPLLAETSMDFRDILREFMMGDQHPFYADMPGIGKKSGTDSDSEKHRDSEPAKENETGRSSEKPRDYKIWEDFPLDFSGAPVSSEKQPVSGDENGGLQPQPEKMGGESRKDGETEQTAAGNGSMQASTAHTGADRTEEKTPEEKTQDRGLHRLIRGFGEKAANMRHAGADRQKALNEPHAFVSYEDYIPAEEKAETADPGVNPEKQVQPEGESKADTSDGSDRGESLPDYQQTEGPDAAAAFGGDPDQDEILYAGDFPTFGQWILNELMNIWIRINGIGDRESTATMEEESENLGREVNVANASRYYGSRVTMLRMRFQIGLVLLAVLAYLSLGFPVSGMLKTAKVNAAMCLGLQLTIMLLCLDIVTNAAINLLRRKFGADGLAVLFCLITSFDALAVAVGGFGNPHIPLCLFSSLSLMGVLCSALLSARALRKSIRVPAIGKRVYCVTAEEGVRSARDLTLLKSVRPVAGFVRRSEEAPPDEMLFSRFALLELLISMVLALFTGIVKHGIGDYLYILSAILTCAVPVTALLAFALPFYIGSQRIFSSGAAIAGWSGMHDIGCSRNLIVTDRDLFPEDTVSIETVRIFADDNAERVIGYAGTMIAASGSGLAPCFAELMEKNGCRMRQVEEFKWLSGGGLQGIIEGHTVLCGNSDLMQLMNVKIPYRLVDRTTVLLAIDGVLYGIFKIQYDGLPEIRSALQELIASNRHPIFAIRDFNITPDLLHEVFDVATDGYDFPPFGDRFRISEAQPSDTSKISAVVCREGLGPLTHLADTGRSMYVAVRLNLIITAAAAVLGMLLVFLRLLGTGTVSAWLPFVIMILDALTVSLISLFMRF